MDSSLGFLFKRKTVKYIGLLKARMAADALSEVSTEPTNSVGMKRHTGCHLRVNV